MVALPQVDPGSGVTPYDRMAFTAREVSDWLAHGERETELRLMFGAAAHAELAALARAAADRRRQEHAAMPVWIVPGIMGSQLSIPRRAGLPADLLWLDALDIILGRLARLRVGAEPELRPSGVLLPTYLRLGLRLEAAGYAVRWFDYDWRLDVATAGHAFATALRRETAPMKVVAHSLGGLVTRVALAQPGTEHVERAVFLGTPQAGSYAAVQALRGSYAVVRKLAMLDRSHDAPTLARDVFHSFPSLHQLLPATDGAADFLDLRSWPSAGLRPDGARLEAARRLAGELSAADARCVGIAGLGSPTVVAAARSDDGREFHYTVSDDGDGTVPRTSATLGTMPLWYTKAAHSDLPRDAEVAAATLDLLTTGRTTRLADRPAVAPRTLATVTDSALQGSGDEKVDWHALDADQRRGFLERLNELP